MNSVQSLRKSYRRFSEGVEVLKSVDLVIEGGEFLSQSSVRPVPGRARSLHVLGTLDKPDSGIRHFSKARRIDESELGGSSDRLRNEHVWIHLPVLPPASRANDAAKRNDAGDGWHVRVGIGGAGSARKSEKQATAILERVGLEAPAANTSHVSCRAAKCNGQQSPGHSFPSPAQSCSPMSRPGNLDARKAARGVVNLLRSVNQDEGVTILMVTHNLELVRHTDRVVRMAAGKIGDQPSSHTRDQLAECAV